MHSIPAISLGLCGGSLAMALTLPQLGWSNEVLAVNAPAKAQVAFQTFTLQNGLRVILAEDHTAPTYSICVSYNVGSRDERPGRTGFAHLFEHMMFQGSANVGKKEHSILVVNNGGSANGTTNADRTNYFETLPANQLELGIFLEADRMRALHVTQANFDNQRQVVQEKRRRNYDNQPYGRTREAVLETAYDNFAYKHSTIGSMEDLNAATLDDARAFFRTYYAPNNAVLSLAGDFQTEVALALITKYFADIPSQPLPPVPDTTEPAQANERRQTIEDAFSQAPRLDIVYKTVPGNAPDFYALSVLGHILAGDGSARLHRMLVKDLAIAVSVSAWPDERRGTSLLWLTVVVRPDKHLPVVEDLMYAELARLQHEPVEDWELEKVQRKLRRQHVHDLYSTRFRANALGHYALYYGEPDLINTRLEHMARVTKGDLQRVAHSYLRETNRTVVTTLPKPQAAPSARSGQEPTEDTP